MLAFVVVALAASAAANVAPFGQQYSGVPAIHNFEKPTQYKSFEYGPAYKTHTFQGFNPFVNEFANKDFVKTSDNNAVVFIVPEHQKVQSGFEQTYSKPAYGFEHVYANPGYRFEQSHAKPGYRFEQSHAKPAYGFEHVYAKPGYRFEQSHAKPGYGFEHTYAKPAFGFEHAYAKPSYGFEQVFVQPAYYGQSFNKNAYGFNQAYKQPAHGFEYGQHVEQAYQPNQIYGNSAYGNSKTFVYSNTPHFGGEYATAHPYNSVNKVYGQTPFAYGSYNQGSYGQKPFYHFQTVVETPAGKKVVETQVAKESFKTFDEQKYTLPSFARFDSDIRKAVSPSFVKKFETKNIKTIKA